uniref:Uncharacterized protein n=1 Tax=Anatid alphaherpesvirus 2 TaxID=3080522 RepID=A0AAU0K8A9_9ALPH
MDGCGWDGGWQRSGALRRRCRLGRTWGLRSPIGSHPSLNCGLTRTWGETTASEGKAGRGKRRARGNACPSAIYSAYNGNWGIDPRMLGWLAGPGSLSRSLSLLCIHTVRAALGPCLRSEPPTLRRASARDHRGGTPLEGLCLVAVPPRNNVHLYLGESLCYSRTD